MGVTGTRVVRVREDVAEWLEHIGADLDTGGDPDYSAAEMIGVEAMLLMRQMCDCFGELDDARTRQTTDCFLGCMTGTRVVRVREDVAAWFVRVGADLDNGEPDPDYSAAEMIATEALASMRQMCDCFGELDDVRARRTVACFLGCDACQTGMESNVNHKTSPSVGRGVGVPQPPEGEARKGRSGKRVQSWA